MTLSLLSDQQLHLELCSLVQHERTLLTKVLHHLREIERRKLFCDFACSSLFDYAVKKLGYSEGQAHRRIQAMRLLRELPEIEAKIASGKLSLSNIAQAQTYFNEQQKKKMKVEKEEKRQVLNCLENKSAREGQKELLKLRPETTLPFERERQITTTQLELRFVINERLKAKLEKVRALLGLRGSDMSYAELIDCMAELSLAGLQAERFGKKRIQLKQLTAEQAVPAEEPIDISDNKLQTITEEKKPTLVQSKGKRRQWIPKAVKHAIWIRDQGRCQLCGGQRNLQIDHIVPVALGGSNEMKNLRLLCFHCNQRSAIKTFGLGLMREFQLRSS